MSIRIVFATALAAMSVATAVPASAADLDYGVAGSAYEDPRYSDIYRHPPPPPRYAAPYAPPPAYREPYYRDERYSAAPVPPPYYGGPPPHYQRDGRAPAGCLPQQVIRDRLQERGWQDFHDAQVAGNVAHVRARRPSGRTFDLTVDRCTGEILQSEAVDGRRADGPPPPQDWRYRDDRYGRY
ncbi:unnamed protein product [Phaeothamnion confervicola]